VNIFKKMFGGLAKTTAGITRSISQVFTGKIDEEFYDDMTAVLLGADIGLEASEQIIDSIREIAKKQGIKTEQALKEALAESIEEILTAGCLSNSSSSLRELGRLPHDLGPLGGPRSSDELLGAPAFAGKGSPSLEGVDAHRADGVV